MRLYSSTLPPSKFAIGVDPSKTEGLFMELTSGLKVLRVQRLATFFCFHSRLESNCSPSPYIFTSVGFFNTLYRKRVIRTLSSVNFELSSRQYTSLSAFLTLPNNTLKHALYKDTVTLFSVYCYNRVSANANIAANTNFTRKVNNRPRGENGTKGLKTSCDK